MATPLFPTRGSDQTCAAEMRKKCHRDEPVELTASALVPSPVADAADTPCSNEHKVKHTHMNIGEVSKQFTLYWSLLAFREDNVTTRR